VREAVELAEGVREAVELAEGVLVAEAAEEEGVAEAEPKRHSPR
jgi:hypothetical protein